MSVCLNVHNNLQRNAEMHKPHRRLQSKINYEAKLTAFMKLIITAGLISRFLPGMDWKG